MEGANNKYGQVALEYLVLFGFLLFGVSILFVYSFTIATEAIAIHKIKDASLRITSAAENIAALGEGSRTTVYVELPDNMNYARVVGNYVMAEARFSSGNSQYAESSSASFTQKELPATQGPHYLTLEVVDGNISISE